MTSTLRAIREAVQTRLAQISGSSYSLDLSGSDRVKVGRYPTPWRLPCAMLFLIQDSADAGKLLAGRERTAKFGVVIWTAAKSADPEVREDALEDAYEDLSRRFRSDADRSLGGLAIDAVPALEDVVGAEAAEAASACEVIASLTVTYREDMP